MCSLTPINTESIYIPPDSVRLATEVYHNLLSRALEYEVATNSVTTLQKSSDPDVPRTYSTDSEAHYLIESAGDYYHHLLVTDYFFTQGEVLKQLARDQVGVYIPPGSGLWLDALLDKNSLFSISQPILNDFRSDMELLRNFCSEWVASRKVFEAAWRELNVQKTSEAENLGEWEKHCLAKIQSE